MKFFIHCWLVTVLILAGPVLAEAGCRAVVRNNNVVVRENVVAVTNAVAVVTPAVAVFQAVAIPVFTYNAQYVPTQAYAPQVAPAYSQPAAVAPCDKHNDAFKQIASLLVELDGRLQRLEGGKPGIPPKINLNPMQPADPPDVPAAGNPPVVDGNRLLALASKNCASCHDQGRAASSGKGFVLLTGGKLAPLTPEQLGNVIDQIVSRKMPRGGTMTDAERLEFVASLVNYPASK